MRYSKHILTVGVIIFIGILVASLLGQEDKYLFWALCLVAVATIPFVIRFELKKTDAREMVLIAMLAAIATVGRVVFSPIPSFTPSSFVIIMTGIIFGAESGFMVGTLCAVLSNLFLGQGPWTPWQMFSWGMMGLTAGLLQNTKLMLNIKFRVLFGFLWGFIFGWIMDVWFIIGFVRPLTTVTAIGGFLASFYFDLSHALANTFFLSVFSKKWSKILSRIKVKYGLLEN